MDFVLSFSIRGRSRRPLIQAIRTVCIVPSLLILSGLGHIPNKVVAVRQVGGKGTDRSDLVVIIADRRVGFLFLKNLNILASMSERRRINFLLRAYHVIHRFYQRPHIRQLYNRRP